MADSVFLAELTWPEFKQKIEAGTVVILPLGATEQHGPHCAMNVDVVLPTGVAARVAREIGAIVAPTPPYGCKSQPRSGGGETFPGCISLDANTFSLMVRDILRELAADGVRRVVVLNGHYENAWPSVEGIDLGMREIRRDGIADMKIMRFEYWDFAKRATHEALFPEGFPGMDLEHASLLETSLMLLLAPDMVDMAKAPTDGPAQFPTYDVYPTPEGFMPASGVLAVAQGSTAEKGRLLMEDHVALISAAIRNEFGL